MTGIIGKKLGMTQIFNEKGASVPVTVIEAGPCPVVQVKTVQRDGYEALKLGFIEARKEKNITKPMKGVYAKCGVKPCRILKEFKMGGLKVGEAVTVESFKPGDRVKVSAISKGKGFQGVMKRHKFSGGPGSHGSMFNRAPGSIGQSSFPSRVFLNLGMPGHMGHERISVTNLLVVEVKPEHNLILLKGAVPGPDGNIVEIRKD
jgi:large subunit ribosomal protein L3